MCLEIQFCWGRECLEGLSVRLVFFDVFQSLIKLLYLLDHDTSTLIKIGTCIRIGIEVWKIHKVITNILIVKFIMIFFTLKKTFFFFYLKKKS